jgi:hypothetical protein
MGNETGRLSKSEQMRLAAILKKLGYTQKIININGKGTRAWTK